MRDMTHLANPIADVQPFSGDLERHHTLVETIDLRDWLRRCQLAGIPVIPGTVCPMEIGTGEILDAGRIAAISEWTEDKVRELTECGSKSMWRWNLCAPIEIKAALSHPNLPVRLPWPNNAIDDARFLAILEECREAGIKTLTTVVRPWIEAAREMDFPVEFRVFVTKDGGTSTSSYYTQRPLGGQWLPQAKQAARLAQALRPHVAADVEYSADFLVTQSGEILFLEGGPPTRYGGDPCCLDPSRPFGDGRIAFGARQGSE